jgi:hypothetical protein
MTGLLADLNAILMFLAGVGMLIFILMKRSYRYFSRRKRQRNEQPLELQPRPKGPWDGVQRDAMANIDRQEVQMFEMARDLNGQLSSRIIVLEKLIANSQRQITQMETLLAEIDEAKSSTPASTSLE